MKTLIALLACLAVNSAFAADSLVVHYGDLDLSRPAASTVLYHRIQQAAEVVCPEYPLGDVRYLRIQRTCVERAVEDAVEHIDNPSLTAVHNRLHRAPVPRTAAR